MCCDISAITASAMALWLVCISTFLWSAECYPFEEAKGAKHTTRALIMRQEVLHLSQVSVDSLSAAIVWRPFQMLNTSSPMATTEGENISLFVSWSAQNALQMKVYSPSESHNYRWFSTRFQKCNSATSIEIMQLSLYSVFANLSFEPTTDPLIRVNAAISWINDPTESHAQRNKSHWIARFLCIKTGMYFIHGRRAKWT